MCYGSSVTLICAVRAGNRNLGGIRALADRTRFTDRAREKFLAVLRETCNVSEAARAIGVSRRAVYDWREAHADFRADWEDAEQEAADKLEREAWRRAVEGTDKPVTFHGAITATYKEYSDRMLELLLKAHKPEKYREKDQNAGNDNLDQALQRLIESLPN